MKYHLAVTLKEEERDREAYKLLTQAVKAGQYFADINTAEQLLIQWKEEKLAEN